MIVTVMSSCGMKASRCGTFDSVTDSSVLSNPADAHNVSCLGLCGRDICPKKLCLIWAGYNPVSIYINE